MSDAPNCPAGCSQSGSDPSSWPRRALVSADVARGTNLASNHWRIPASSPSRIDALGAVRAPTLVVHGTDDPLYRPDHAKVIADAVPGARLELLDGVGHEIPTNLVPGLTMLLISHLNGH